MRSIDDVYGPKSGHCSNLEGDRALGQKWERLFCALAAKSYDKSFTAHQIGREGSATAIKYRHHPLTLPDITIWTAPGEHHEIKHKSATKSGCYGLEEYRFDALKWFAEETGQFVMYTIHDHERLGRDAIENVIEDWYTVEVLELWRATVDGRAQKSAWNSWVNGNSKLCSGWYWHKSIWVPLSRWWGEEIDTRIIPITGVQANFFVD
jgi:hypothetical protein